MNVHNVCGKKLRVYNHKISYIVPEYISLNNNILPARIFFYLLTRTSYKTCVSNIIFLIRPGR
jgi:abortive infection bacteriophage resistance protein